MPATLAPPAPEKPNLAPHDEMQTLPTIPADITPEQIIGDQPTTSEPVQTLPEAGGRHRAEDAIPEVSKTVDTILKDSEHNEQRAYENRNEAKTRLGRVAQWLGRKLLVTGAQKDVTGNGLDMVRDAQAHVEETPNDQYRAEQYKPRHKK